MKQLRHQDNPKYKIDESRKVFIYKNLHKDCWSVKQDGLVKMHTHDLSLFDCSFRVNYKGQGQGTRGEEEECPRRCQRIHRPPLGRREDISREGQKTKCAMYNPYKYKSFVRVDDDSKPVFWSSTARLSKTKGGKDRVYFVPSIDSANQLQ